MTHHYAQTDTVSNPGLNTSSGLKLAASQQALHLDKNLQYLTVIINSQRQGKTALPNGLGLSDENVIKLENLFKLQGKDISLSVGGDAEDLRQQLLEMRQDEWLDIKTLLVEHINTQSETSKLMAEVVAAACLGGEHLWRDLGLLDRAALSDLLTENFTSLAKRNDKDMKWKKFFYKQLCEQEGGYVCRAPSCSECAAYADCFGPED